jgi:hypothetical protein
MRAAALSDFAGGARALEASPTVLRRCPAVADGRAARGYKRGCSGMFPGPSRQTPREPDLGNPYRVDLGTAMFRMGTEGHDKMKESKVSRWTGRAKQNYDDNAKHDTYAPHEGNIAAFAAEHENDKEKNRIAVEKARVTQEKLNRIDEQLQRVKNTQEEKKNAEMEKNEVEKMKMEKETALKNAHSNMEQELARLQKLRP